MQHTIPWIDAYWEPNQGIKTFNNCLAIADLESNEDNKLVCLNFFSQPELKIFKGTSLFAETLLPDIPCAVTTVYTDVNEPKLPGIAVACGSHILIYRNARPYFKFTLPLLDGNDEEINNLETDIWRQKSDTRQLVRLLQDLSIEHGYSNLSSPSQQLLAMNDDQREQFLSSNGHIVIKNQMIITNMTKLPKGLDVEKSVECLIVTTESAHLFILDPESFTVVQQCKLPGVTSHLCVEGTYTVDFNIIFATRNGYVYKLQRGLDQPECLTSLMSLPVAMELDNSRFLVACTDSTLLSFSLKGQKEWCVCLQGSPAGLAVLPSNVSELTVAVVCNVIKKGIAEGVMFLYKGTELIYSLHVQGPIQAFVCGMYGYGEYAFIFNIVGGGLSIKLLKRSAHFGVNEKCASLASSLSHNFKLMVPKKSKIFVEQTLREREQAKEIYHWFQKTWQGMKVLVGESYLNALDKSVISNDQEVKLTAQVLGLGPRLKLFIQLQNMSDDAVLMNLGITFLYDPNIYTVDKSFIAIPMLIPNMEYNAETFVTCVLNMNSTITIIVCNDQKVILSGIVNMPPAIAGPIS